MVLKNLLKKIRSDNNAYCYLYNLSYKKKKEKGCEKIINKKYLFT